MKGKMMKVTLVKPGEFSIGEVDIPKPGKDEVLVKVFRVGVCGSDVTIYRGHHPYAISPLVMGHEFAGTVEEVGSNVKGIGKNTRVTVIPHVVCGKCKSCETETYNFCEELKCMGAEDHGAHANYVCVSSKMVIPIPETMSMDAAAMVEPACVGYHGARRAEITSNDSVLVFGAGPIGLFTMQSVRVLGAKKVFVADVDEWRLELAEKLGADGTINISEEKIEDGLIRVAGGEKEIDVFLDCVGLKGQALDTILRIARRGSRTIVIGVLQNGYDIPHLPDFVQHELRISGSNMYVPKDYKDMVRLMGEGKIKINDMITHYFELKEIKKVFEMIDSRKEKYFKIMLKVAEE